MLLGFDIGGTKCAVVLGTKNSNHDLQIIDKQVLPTDKPVYAMIDWLYATAEALLLKQGLTAEAIEGIGISCGGPLSSKKGLILSPPNLPGWDHIPIVMLTEKRFGRKTLLQNDANACAMAEWKHGAGKGYSNLIFLTFGTGMGAGLILDGKLYSGTTDLAGEVGHLRLARRGPVGFGKEGSFEGFCSGGGIAQLAQVKVRQKLQMGQPVSFCQSLEDLPFLTAKIVAEAAYAGDPVAQDIYRTCGQFLGAGLSLLIDILNPEIIIMGSIYGRAQELLEPDMREVIAAEAITESYQACRIVPALLAENIGDIAALCLAETMAAESTNPIVTFKN
ncbi:ROK family protein [Adhaeribacter pallidiroseus]|uniref:Glucokinase n=1 Tax=Adhaeribacter pallidiroseus TaxID=2072847 RepID=A0A369QD83_9BACT|nr:ROK family protein [Adhaeribacter pallidiroseus]RDC62654.1 Glucokinase [Adhaeribacter pallidiroseus]